MVHGVRNESLALQNPRRRRPGEVVRNVHVVHVDGSVDGDVVGVGEAVRVVERGPVGRLGEDVGGGGEVAELGVVAEHGWVDLWGGVLW